MKLSGHVMAVAAGAWHRFSKPSLASIGIVAGHGVDGDAHAGSAVKHRSRVAADPAQPNLRQVHLIHGELLDALADEGFTVAPGQLGENVTTRGMDLLTLPTGTLLRLGDQAVLEVTGLRNPCRQIEAFRPGLLGRLARKRGDGSIERLAGIMCVARKSGRVAPGDPLNAELPPAPYRPLKAV
ncbi:MOSC domain-containing protein [Alteraurantiacibacter aquimixticola]|uniref:MOSC domain-containing protein n=2 Tax=Alteraurantiacibacter aquimixticola TaxID=2489173 RepID=A0A4T3F0W9_9SPHN|nr:MOSC domain-containing protein [Alteraurantiacibacter aquimixticola]